LDYNGPNYYAETRIIRPGEGLEIFALQRLGVLYSAQPVTLLVGGKRLVVKVGGDGDRMQPSPAVGISVEGFRLGTRPHPMFNFRYWVCPLCQHDCVRVYAFGEGWCCRRCARYDYSCRHQNRMVVGRTRALWIRRRLGLDPRLFAPLPDLNRRLD